MKRYLLLDPGNSEAGRLALGKEEWAQGRLRVIDIREHQARTLLEQLPLADQEATACLVTVNRGRVHAVGGRRLAWQLIWLLGPLQGRRIWDLVRQTGFNDQGGSTQAISSCALSNICNRSRGGATSCSKDNGGFVASARKFVALGGMLGILVLAWWFDRLYEFARLGVGPFARLGAGPVYPNPLLRVSAITDWTLAALVLLLAWFALFKHAGSALVFFVFLLVGLLVMFSFLLEVPLAESAPLLYQPLAVVLPIVSPRSLAFHASAFISIIGVIGLLARRRS